MGVGGRVKQSMDWYIDVREEGDSWKVTVANTVGSIVFAGTAITGEAALMEASAAIAAVGGVSGGTGGLTVFYAGQELILNSSTFLAQNTSQGMLDILNSDIFNAVSYYLVNHSYTGPMIAGFKEFYNDYIIDPDTLFPIFTSWLIEDYEHFTSLALEYYDIIESGIESFEDFSFETFLTGLFSEPEEQFDNGLILDDTSGTWQTYDFIEGSSFGQTIALDGEYHYITGGTSGVDTVSYSGVVAPKGLDINLISKETRYEGEAGVKDFLGVSVGHIIGSDLNDTITGNDNNNVLKGGLGADTIYGGSGNDILFTRSNSSAVSAEADYVDAGAGNDAIYGDGYDTLIGGAGNDYIESKGNSSLNGGAGVDFYKARTGDVITDSDGGQVNGISFVYGSEGKLLWRDGAGVNPFVFKGADLYIYTGVIVEQAYANNFFVIKNFLSQNDGSWGFTIPTEYLHTTNDLILSTSDTPAPTGEINPEDSITPLSNPTSGHPNENPNASNPTLMTFDTNEVERGYTAHQNYFAATKGYDTKYGGTEQDTYEWGSGFHNDVIIDAGGSSDRVVLSNLNESDVTIIRSGDDIRITVTATGEKLTLENAYISGNEIETLEFADGSTLSLALSASGHSNAIEFIESTGAVDDVIVALGGDDTIHAWEGDDSIDGGAGDDVIWSRSGQNTVDGGAGNDVITFELSYTSHNEVYGGMGNDLIQTSRGVDTLRGGLGDDTIEGYLGDDTYIWAAGDGNDVYEESSFSGGGIDTVWFTGGIIASDVTVYGTVGNSVHINYIPTGETITLQGQFIDGDKIIENLTFDDGSIINLSAISEWRGDEANNDIDGTSGSDTIIGNAGDDTLGGYKGDDTYVWQSGDGNDLIRETNTNISGTDTLSFTGGITLADLDIYGTTGSDVNITYIPTGETITIDNQLSSNSRYHIESLSFDDGSVHNFSGFEVRGASDNDSLYGGNYDDTLVGNEGDDRLSSGVGNDVIIGGAGDDWLLGYRGDDTYVWAAGDGNDLIQENNVHLSGANDILLLTGGIVAADVTFSQVSNDLLITHAPTGEVITIDNQYSSNSRYDVEILQFDDGTSIDLLGI